MATLYSIGHSNRSLEDFLVLLKANRIEALADIAFEVNRTTQNIGARRLHTILERVLEDVSFEGPDLSSKQVVIDGKYVRGRLDDVLQKEDLSRFIL